MMSEGTVSELCRVLQKQGYRGDAVSVFADSLAYITHLESQLAARNQAAEAMGVLEEMLRDEQGDMRQLDIYYHPNAGYSVILTHANREELADGYSDDLIEAVLKAGGEG